MRAAEIFDRSSKEKGQRNGALGHIALDILRYMLRRRNWKTGQLDPSIETMAKELRRARASIVGALARLRRHGFIDWIRRTEPVEDCPPFGPQVKQASNAYFFGLPTTALEFVRRLTARAPIPDDHAAREIEQAEQLQRMIAGLSAVEVARFHAGDKSVLSAALAALARSIDRSNNASSLSGQNPALLG